MQGSQFVGSVGVASSEVARSNAKERDHSVKRCDAVQVPYILPFIGRWIRGRAPVTVYGDIMAGLLFRSCFWYVW